MQLTDFLASTGGVSSLARELGLSEQQAAAGAAALLPAILGGLHKQAPAGGNGLGDLLEQFGGAGLLDDVLSPAPTPVERGNQALGRIFGSKDVSRAVAQHAAGKTGLDPRMLRKMLPIVMMLISGFMAKKRRADAVEAKEQARAEHEAKREAQREAQRARRAGHPGSYDGDIGALLESHGRGNPLDDILRQMGRPAG